MFIITTWWFISAHKWFKGPKINVEHRMLGGEGVVLDGMEHALEHPSDSDSIPTNKKADAEYVAPMSEVR
jgi:hypothetical protein